MSSTQLLLGTGGAAAGVYIWAKMGYGYDGITSPGEIKIIDIIGGGVVAMILNYFAYGIQLDSSSVILSLVEGGCGVAVARSIMLMSGSS